MMTDPIADLLTRVRNAYRRRQTACTMPGSKLKVAVLEAMKREGYIEGYDVASEGPKSAIQVRLRYGPEGESVIHNLRRVSTPGCRRYRGVDELPRPRAGMGVSIVSTNRGVLSDRECREHRVGGEVLCVID